MAALELLDFDNNFARLTEAFFRRVKPKALPTPYLVAFNERAAELFGLDLLRKVLQKLFDEQLGMELFNTPPEESKRVAVSCS